MLLSVESSVTNLEIAIPTEILFTEGSYVLVQPTKDSTSDIIIAQILSDVTDECNVFTAIVYSNDVLDTLNLFCSGEHTVPCSRIIREIHGV